MFVCVFFFLCVCLCLIMCNFFSFCLSMCFSLSIFVYVYQFVYLCLMSLLFMCIFSSVKCLYFSFCLPTSICLFLNISCVSIFDLFPFDFVFIFPSYYVWASAHTSLTAGARHHWAVPTGYIVYTLLAYFTRSQLSE